MNLLNRLRIFFISHRTAVVIFLVSFIVHAAASCFLYSRFGGDVLFFENEDAYSYTNLAKSVVRGEGFSFNGEVSAVRTPLWPIILAGVYVLHLPQVPAILFIQNIAASLTVVFIFCLGRMFFSKRSGLIAAGIYTIEPYLLMSANLATTEILFNLWIVLGVWFFLRWYNKHEGLKCIAWSGVFLGAATLTRPITLYLPLLLLLFFIERIISNRRELLPTLRAFLLFVFCFTAIIAPWSIRQYIHYKTPRITTIDAMMVYFKTAPLAVAAEQGISYDEATRRVAKKLEMSDPNFKPSDVYNTFKYHSFMMNEAVAMIKMQPTAILRSYAVSLIPALTGTGYEYMLENIGGLKRAALRPSYSHLLLTHGIRGLQTIFTKLDIFQITLLGSILLWCIIYTLIGVAFFITKPWKTNWRVWLVFIACIGYFVIFTLGPETHARYRVPTFPFWFLLLGYSIDVLLCRLKGRKAHNA